jgi:hypothetical protein
VGSGNPSGNGALLALYAANAAQATTTSAMGKRRLLSFMGFEIPY